VKALLVVVAVVSVATAQWRERAPMPEARSEVAGAAYRGGIAVVGGFRADGSSSERVDYYRPASGWSSLPDLPVAVNHAMAGVVGPNLVVVGGYGASGPLRRAFALDDSGWRELPPPPEPRAAAGAAVVGGKLYVVGGVTGNGLARTMLVLDPTRRRWTTLRGPTPREHLGVVSLAGRIYAVGGRTAGFDTNLTLVEAWQSGRGWRKLPSLPSARGGTGVAAAAGSLVSVGGEATTGTIASVYRFRPGARRWTRLPDLPTPRHGLAVVGLANTVYVIAGGPEPGLHVSTANESLALSP
jgi:N-acetylneuraminic acid mutarotase